MRKAKPLPSVEYLQECFTYDQSTGLLVWAHRPLHHFKGTYGFNIFEANYAGKQAFTCSDGGYYRGAINGAIYRAHRVIWKLMTGDEPEIIDHVNGNGLDNSWGNLRAANPSGNARNARLRKDSKSGVKGVCWDQSVSKWMSQIRVDTRTKFLGHFDDKQEAYAAYCAAAATYHKEFACLG